MTPGVARRDQVRGEGRSGRVPGPGPETRLHGTRPGTGSRKNGSGASV